MLGAMLGVGTLTAELGLSLLGVGEMVGCTARVWRNIEHSICNKIRLYHMRHDSIIVGDLVIEAALSLGPKKVEPGSIRAAMRTRKGGVNKQLSEGDACFRG